MALCLSHSFLSQLSSPLFKMQNVAFGYVSPLLPILTAYQLGFPMEAVQFPSELFF